MTDERDIVNRREDFKRFIVFCLASLVVIDLMQPSKGKKEVGFLLLFGISIAKMRRLLICTRDIRDFIKREMYLYN